MISAGDFRNGVTIELEGNIYQIIEFQHVKPRRRNEPGKRKRRPVATCGKLIRTTSGCP